jgi:hypothetical protein
MRKAFVFFSCDRCPSITTVVPPVEPEPGIELEDWLWEAHLPIGWIYTKTKTSDGRRQEICPNCFSKA